MNQESKYDEVVHRLYFELYDIDIDGMNDAEIEASVERAERRRELQQAKGRLTHPERFEPVPIHELDEDEQLRRRKLDLLDAKLAKVSGGQSNKKKENETLKNEVEILRAMNNV